MRPGSEQARHSAAGREAGTYDTVLIFRLVGASVLFAVSLIIDKLPDFVGVLLLILLLMRFPACLSVISSQLRSLSLPLPWFPI